MTTGPDVVTDADHRQAEPEVRVVVDRIELDGLLELRLRSGESAAPEVRTAESLANRSLCRLEVASALKHDRSRVGVVVGE